MSNRHFISKEAKLQPDVQEHASLLYAMAEMASALQYRHPMWEDLLSRAPEVGDMVVVTCMWTPKPIEHVGRLVFDDWVLIPSWGPVAIWDPRDQEEHRNGGKVGKQREWGIVCLDGVRRNFTNVKVIRLPQFKEVPRI